MPDLNVDNQSQTDPRSIDYLPIYTEVHGCYLVAVGVFNYLSTTLQDFSHSSDNRVSSARLKEESMESIKLGFNELLALFHSPSTDDPL